MPDGRREGSWEPSRPPWKATTRGGRWLVTGPGSAVVCDLNPQLFGGDGRRAARLLAAAPELLECCQRMLELHQTGAWGAPPDEYLPLIEAAVRKATGS